MTETAPSTQHGQVEAPGLVAGLIAAFNTAATLGKLLPTIFKTSASYYLYGPPKTTWPLRLALFTAVARYQSQTAAAERQLSGKPVDALKVTQAQRDKIEKLMTGGLPEQPKDGAFWSTEFGIKNRGLKGVLAELDAEESGTRKIRAEWTVHRDELSNPTSPDRVLLYTHGGAYTVMSTRTHRGLVAQLSKQLKCRALSVDYRLSPETRYPGALLDAVSAYFYLTEELGIPASSIIVSGDSAGGNLVMALMLYLRDSGLPQVGGAVLLSPWLDLTASLSSWDENKDYDYLSAPIRSDTVSPVRLFMPPGKFDDLIATPYASPALTASLTSLPPLLVQSGGAELLRDEHALFAKRAAMAGVDVMLETYKDGVHVFQAVQAETVAKSALKAIGEWATERPQLAGGQVKAETFTTIDAELQKAWDARPKEEKTMSEPLIPASFSYEKIYEQPVPIKLREDAHEAAKKAVEEVEGYQLEEKRSVSIHSKVVLPESTGVFGRVRGLLHL
ncbi:hypothetical protein JCM11641_005983 [Rhodosporidiobolus odoratus]